jgi:Xaa-Pro aminopeptidase
VSSADKRQQLARELTGRQQQAAVLTQPDGIAWLLNIRGADVPFSPLTLAFAILHADASVELFVDREKVTAAARAHLGAAVTIAPPEAFVPALQRLGESGATVAVDPELTPAAAVQQLEKAGASLAFRPDCCALPKAVKNPVELAGIRAAHVRDGVALCRFLAWLAAKAPAGRVSEIDAVERLAAFRAMGQHYRGPSFPTISGAGSNGAIVHYRVTEASNRCLEPGTLYLVDSGGQYLDGTTDVTRTVAIGNPDERARVRFTQVLKGHIALARAVFPKGTTGAQLDTLARVALWRAGVDYDHGTGHGVGAYLGVHEGPHRISKQPSPVPLACGMVMSNEPGYYQPGAYGIRIENLVTVVPAAGGEDAELEMLAFETLTLAPIDLALVCEDLLTVEERDWLDAYHRRVRDELSPLLDAATAAWLEAATGHRRG